jgi:hypothetical protein
MRKFVALGAAALIAVGLAGPAQAYDRDGYSYAAGHMIGYKDIPKSLDAKRGASLDVYNRPGKNYVCSVDSKDVEYAGGVQNSSMGFQGRKGTSVNVNVAQYASTAEAIKAFDALKKGAPTCEGPNTGSQTFDDGSTDSWSNLITTGNVPMVTVAGVESIFVNQNYDDVTTGEYGGRYSSDTYSVYTLVNDVIIETTYYTGSELNMTTKQRKAVNQVAFNAVTRWLG